MTTVYVIGAGFSKTCGIATDMEMLDVLNPLLSREDTAVGRIQTFIEAIKRAEFSGAQFRRI